MSEFVHIKKILNDNFDKWFTPPAKLIDGEDYETESAVEIAVQLFGATKVQRKKGRINFDTGKLPCSNRYGEK